MAELRFNGLIHHLFHIWHIPGNSHVILKWLWLNYGYTLNYMVISQMLPPLAGASVPWTAGALRSGSSASWQPLPSIAAKNSSARWISWQWRKWCRRLGFMIKWYTSSTAQGGGGSFKNSKPIGEVGCCESRMAERIHWWTERCLELCFLEWLQWLQWSPHHNCWM